MPNAEQHFRKALSSREFTEMLSRHGLEVKPEGSTSVSLHSATDRGNLIVRVMLANKGTAHVIPLQSGSWRDKAAVRSMGKAEAVAKILSQVLPKEIKVVIPAK